jgi:hypothetical protein
MNIIEKIDEHMEINEAASLSQKHFIAIAEIMKSSKTLDALKSNLLIFFKSNPNFDEDRFKKAAGMKKNIMSNYDLKNRFF